MAIPARANMKNGAINRICESISKPKIGVIVKGAMIQRMETQKEAMQKEDLTLCLFVIDEF
jgi:hypothetical protein